MSITLTRRITLRPEVFEQAAGSFKDILSRIVRVLKTGKTETGQSYLIVQFEDYFNLLTFELARKGMMDDDILTDILGLCESSEDVEEDDLRKEGAVELR